MGLRLGPGCTHDLTAAREQVLPRLYPHAVRGLSVLTDRDDIGAGAGIRTPAEGGNALLGRWRAPDRVTVCPQRIRAIVAADLVLNVLDRGQ